MSMTPSRVAQVATRGKLLADRLKGLYRDTGDFLKYNSNQAIDWAAATKPTSIENDEAGNLAGQDFDRIALANLINTLTQFKALMDGQVPSQGDYIGVVNSVARVDA
jgi:hypothetical protein